MNEQKTNSPSAEQVVVALRNQVFPDRSRLVSARLHAALSPSGKRVFERMELYRRLGGAR